MDPAQSRVNSAGTLSVITEPVKGMWVAPRRFVTRDLSGLRAQDGPITLDTWNAKSGRKSTMSS